MKDILEFKAFIKNDFHFTDKMVNDFIYFLESKSIYWGGGYDKYYIQGSLYGDESLNLNKMSFSEELTAFFQSLNKDIKLDIKYII